MCSRAISTCSSLGALALLLCHIGMGTCDPRELGEWQIIGHSGVPAMHAALMQTGKVIFLDKAEPWTYAVINGEYTFSTEFDPKTGKTVPLTVTSNTFCSAGGFLPDGTLVNVGGAEAFRKKVEGYNRIRLLKPCNPKNRIPSQCDWQDHGTATLSSKRWYPTVASLSDGRLFVLGGSTKSADENRPEINQASYEIYPNPRKSVPIQFLKDSMPNNLYPGVHLLPNGHLFIWANNKAISFDYKNDKEISKHADIPGYPRSYPLTGSSVLLPLDPANDYAAEVIVFGGSQKHLRRNWIASPGDNTLQRIDLSKSNPAWQEETMPYPRVMPDGVILATGDVFISNGARQGIAGFNTSTIRKADRPVLTPILYSPYKRRGSRFTKLMPSTIPRMYHSVSLLLPDGRVLVSGSNPIDKPTEHPPASIKWGTEFRVEAYSPPHLFSTHRRLDIIAAPEGIRYGEKFTIRIKTFSQEKAPVVRAALVHTGFSTHSNHMSQRYVKLKLGRSRDGYVTFTAPPHGAIAPPGPYMLFVLENDLPCRRARFLILG